MKNKESVVAVEQWSRCISLSIVHTITVLLCVFHREKGFQ